jgi:hypothetical protein
MNHSRIHHQLPLGSFLGQPTRGLCAGGVEAVRTRSRRLLVMSIGNGPIQVSLNVS